MDVLNAVRYVVFKVKSKIKSTVRDKNQTLSQTRYDFICSYMDLKGEGVFLFTFITKTICGCWVDKICPIWDSKSGVNHCKSVTVLLLL